MKQKGPNALASKEIYLLNCCTALRQLQSLGINNNRPVQSAVMIARESEYAMQKAARCIEVL
jgi:hypothetical protein